MSLDKRRLRPEDGPLFPSPALQSHMKKIATISSVIYYPHREMTIVDWARDMKVPYSSAVPLFHALTLAGWVKPVRRVLGTRTSYRTVYRRVVELKEVPDNETWAEIDA